MQYPTSSSINLWLREVYSCHRDSNPVSGYCTSMGKNRGELLDFMAVQLLHATFRHPATKTYWQKCVCLYFSNFFSSILLSQEAHLIERFCQHLSYQDKWRNWKEEIQGKPQRSLRAMLCHGNGLITMNISGTGMAHTAGSIPTQTPPDVRDDPMRGRSKPIHGLTS